jgi:pteridine reductase
MPKWDLHGRVALVTGAGTRVGAAIARRLVGAGCDLVVHYATNRAGAEAVVQEARTLGRRAWALRADLCDREQISALAEESLSCTAGRLDVLVHNAANFERVPPAELTAGHWDRAMALNATTPYLLTLKLAGALRAARGTVIAIACTSALKPWTNFLPYATSKAALAHLVKGLAVALAPQVRVNAVAPGAALLPEDYDQAKRGRLLGRIPLGRFGEPDDIGRAVVFLAESDYITGHILAVDGGLSLG